MPNMSAFRSKLYDSGITITALARKTGMSRAAFYKKMQGDSEFKLSEIVSICNALRLTNEERDHIFFS